MVTTSDSSQNQSHSLLDFLIRSSNIDATDEDGNSFLHLAALQGNIGLATKCIESGSDPNHRNKDAKTPLHFAAENGDENMVRLLLSAGARKDVRDCDGETPAFAAVRSGTTNAVKLLFPATENVNKRGENLLHAAVQTTTGDDEMLATLLKFGGDVNRRNDLWLTPLELACISGNLSVIPVLLDRTHPLPTTLLHLTSSSSSPNAPSVLNYLLTEPLPKGAVDARDVDGRTPLHRAVECGRWDAARVLLANGADVNAVDADGVGCLYLAVFANDEEMVEALVETGADVGVATWNGDGLLHVAAGRARKAVVEVLLKSGIKVSSVNRDGYKPSDVARQLGRKEMASFLENLEGRTRRLRFRGVSESEEVLNSKIEHIAKSSIVRSKSISRLNFVDTENNSNKTKIPVRRSRSIKIK